MLVSLEPKVELAAAFYGFLHIPWRDIVMFIELMTKPRNVISCVGFVVDWRRSTVSRVFSAASSFSS